MPLPIPPLLGILSTLFFFEQVVVVAARPEHLTMTLLVRVLSLYNVCLFNFFALKAMHAASAVVFLSELPLFLFPLEAIL
jgi:hypothetical protein